MRAENQHQWKSYHSGMTAELHSLPLYKVTGSADISRSRSLPIIAHHFKMKALGEGKHY